MRLPIPSPRARYLGAALASAAVLLGGCGRNEAAGPPPAPPQVGTVTLAPERAALTTVLPGRTSPYQLAEIRPQVNGLLLARRFEEGADVRAGALLYQIDPAPYEAAVERAAASLAMAEANLPAARSRAERLRGLAETRAVGEQAADDALAALGQAEAAVGEAKAALATARIQLSYTPIRAPISGRTGRSSVTPGALVTAYQPMPLVTVQQLDPIYVDVQQSSAELLHLRQVLSAGQLVRDEQSARRVRLLLEDGTPYGREGTLGFRDVTVAPATGAVTLRMVFPNPDHFLLPGMFVRAEVEEGVDERAILVPQQGVARDPRGIAYALVVGADGKVESRDVEVDRAIGNRWRVTRGLAAGDRVIVDGLLAVRPGMPVTAVEASPASAGGAAKE